MYNYGQWLWLSWQSSSNPVIGEFLKEHFFTLNCIGKTKMKKKRPRIAHFVTKHSPQILLQKGVSYLLPSWRFQRLVRDCSWRPQDGTRVDQVFRFGRCDNFLEKRNNHLSIEFSVDTTSTSGLNTSWLVWLKHSNTVWLVSISTLILLDWLTPKPCHTTLLDDKGILIQLDYFTHAF